MQTTLIPDVYNKVVNALKHNHPEYMENINELAKLWKENLIKKDISLTDKLVEVEIPPPNPIEHLSESSSETSHTPFVLLDSFKRFRLPTKDDCRPPKRFKNFIPIPQYDGANDIASDDEEINTETNTNTNSVENEEPTETVEDDHDLSDDEHDDDTFISSNVAVCQYSQLTRRIHKWKMKLSKGVCYVNNKNYVFGSCSADIRID